jgi:hypothetical protein
MALRAYPGPAYPAKTSWFEPHNNSAPHVQPQADPSEPARAPMHLGLMWGAVAGASTAGIILLALTWAGYPQVDADPYSRFVPFIYWAVVAPAQILLGALVGSVAGAACCAADARHRCVGALLGGAGVTSVMLLWLFVQFA